MAGCDGGKYRDLKIKVPKRDSDATEETFGFPTNLSVNSSQNDPSFLV